MKTNSMGAQPISRLLSAFLKDHPEYGSTLRTEMLAEKLESAYEAVIHGSYTAKTEDVLQAESAQVGLSRNHYLDLVNMTVHAASNQPLESDGGTNTV